MGQIKAVLTDYIGTLTYVHSYTMEASMAKLHDALVDTGFSCGLDDFLVAYGKAHEKYRLIRYGELREVTNAVWVAETLCSLGYNVKKDNAQMKTALDEFFQDYIDSLELRPCAETFLKQTHQHYKLGLVSNFTYGPVVHISIEKLGIRQYFDTVVVSGDYGWRKPHPNIFQAALHQLGVSACETVFLGDSPAEDIKGASEVGLKTIFVQSQFYGPVDLAASGQTPTHIATDLEQICSSYSAFINQ